MNNKFIKGYISSSLVLYLMKLSNDQLKKSSKTIGAFIPVCLQDEFKFILDNLNKKWFEGNSDWKYNISNLSLETKVKNIDYDYYGDFVVEIVFGEMKLYETKGLVEDIIKMIF